MGGKTCKPVVEFDEVCDLLRDGPPLDRFQRRFREMTGRADLSGTLDFPLFRETFGAPFREWGDLVLRRLFDVMDTDNSKDLNYREFLQAVFVFQNGTDEQRLRFVFNMYDLDNNGMVSRKDFLAIAEPMIVRRRLMEGGGGGGAGGGGAGAGDVVAMSAVDRRRVGALFPEGLKPLVEGMADFSFLAFDFDSDGQLSFSDWKAFAESDDDVAEFLRTMRQVIPLAE